MDKLVSESHTLKQSTWLQSIGKAFLWTFGWRVVGDMPNIKKSVIVAAPHTSNWDFVLLLMSSFVIGLRGQWIGKDAMFIGPLGWIFRALGGIALDRDSSHDIVGQAVDAFNKSTAMTLVIAAEGTRKKSDHWKSGFYYMALGAGVPILLAFNDYRTKTCGIGPAVQPTGDLEADLAKIRDFYATITPRYPAQRSEVRFRH